ncbi:hypothetical protein ACFSQ7_14715 [Paenibacillus rhizoplanae]
MSKIVELEQVVEAQEGRIANLEKHLNKAYAKDYEKAVQAAKDAGVITTSADKSKLELNVITMLVKLGLAKQVTDFIFFKKTLNPR